MVAFYFASQIFQRFHFYETFSDGLNGSIDSLSKHTWNIPKLRIIFKLYEWISIVFCHKKRESTFCIEKEHSYGKKMSLFQLKLQYKTYCAVDKPWLTLFDLLRQSVGYTKVIVASDRDIDVKWSTRQIKNNE